MATTNPLKTASSNNLVIVFLLISLLVVGGSVLVGKSLVTSIVRDGKVVAAKNKANKQLDENLAAAPKLVEAYSGLGSTGTLLADALPTTPDLPSLLVMMENLAGDAGISLKTVSPAQASSATLPVGIAGGGSATAPQAYGFSIGFDGTFDSLKKFLANVELSARPMRVVGLQINGSGHSLSGTMELQTYYQGAATLPFSTETIK